MVALVDVRNGQVIDFSPACSLEESRGWVAQFGLWLTDNWVVENPTAIPFRESSYDLVIYR